MAKHVAKHRPSVEDTNNNMGPFGLIRGIFLLGSAIHDHSIESREREENRRKTYDSKRGTYYHRCGEYTWNGKQVFTDYDIHGEGHVQRDIHGNIIRNFTQEAESRELAELDKKYPGRVTVKEYNHGICYTNYQLHGFRVIDRQTGKLLCVRIFDCKCNISNHLNYTQFYMDPETFHLVRLTDIAAEIDLRCSYNHKEYHTKNDINNFIGKYNFWIDKFQDRNAKYNAVTGYSSGLNAIPKEFVSANNIGFPEMMNEETIQREVLLRKEIH